MDGSAYLTNYQKSVAKLSPRDKNDKARAIRQVANVVLDLKCEVEGVECPISTKEAIAIGMVKFVKENPTPQNVMNLMKIIEEPELAEAIDVDYVDDELSGKEIK